MFYTITSSK